MFWAEWGGYFSELAGRYLGTDTEIIQGGMWAIVCLALIYTGWELLRRRNRRRQGNAALVALPFARGRGGERHEINGHEVVIGRGEEADICVPDQSVALAHAAIAPAGPSYRLTDLGSREGVKLNGRRVIGEALLRDGDLLDVGGRPFRFHQERPPVWKPEIWTWVLLAAASALFIFMQWAAWAEAAPGRPSPDVVYRWSLGLTAGAWLATAVVRKRRGTLDPLFLPAALVLFGLGLVVLLRTQPQFYERQTMAGALGLLALTAAGALPLQVLAKYRYLFLVGGIALLLMTLFLGHRVGDQQLAISLWGFQFQPAEPAKLLLAIFLAGLISERQELVARTGRSWTLTRADVRYLGPMVLAWGVALGLLIVQRDLGTALLFFGLFLAFIGMASGRFIFVLVSLGAFVFGAVLSVAAFDRVRERIDLWLNPWQDPQGLGYQVSQGLFALAAGGLKGLGLGNGFPYLIPAGHTDLPMAIIGEELGLIATLGVLALLAVIIFRGYRAALKSDDDFLGLLAAGLTTVLALQAVVIIGGLVRLLPLTGVTLPFVSFGGSSLVTNLALIGVLIGVSALAAERRPQVLTRATRRAPSANRFSWKRQLRWVGSLAAIGFIALGGFLHHWQMEEARAMTANPANPRLLILEPRLNRGQILSVHGEVIADSIYKDGRYRRRVPTGSLYAGILGYNSIKYGGTGVEGAANFELLGGRDINSIADALKRTWSGVPGDSVRLTINDNLQKKAGELLGSRKGSIVAIDPRTGAVRAMVSSPRYSLHRIDERWEELNKDPRQPLLFQAAHGVYPPGSTFKVITAAVALDEGVVTPQTKFYCPGSANIGSYVWNCFRGKAHGHLTFADALRVSCNVTFGKVGKMLGKERLVEGAKRLGIGISPPMAITTGNGLIDPYNEPWPSVPAQIGFGQGPLAVTPLQMALATAGVANDGKIMKPYLIEEYQTPQGESYNQAEPEVWLDSIDPKAAQNVRNMMARVVEAGTGRAAQLPGIKVGGKTGTAENPHGKDHAWFISAAPIDNPKIVVVAIVEGGGLGGATAAPLVQEMLATHFGVKLDKKK